MLRSSSHPRVEGKHSLNDSQNESQETKRFGHHDMAEISNLAFNKMSIHEIDKDIEYRQWRKSIGAPIKEHRNSQNNNFQNAQKINGASGTSSPVSGMLCMKAEIQTSKFPPV